jgi:16S rRNA (guanine1207-N2)-methyltransferase
MPPSTSIAAELLGERFRFQTAPGLFSGDRVDDGTRLLLEHLPPTAPRRVLDLGCGYGALGLPIAARHRDARFLLVDRDTLAVEYARRNAEAHGLSHVEARASLGYRDVGTERFDQVLCNVPARIGEAAIAYILGEGARLLQPGGELRVVVIRDLGPVVERLAREHGWPVQKSAEGARHLVYALPPLPPAPGPVDHESLYLRDVVRLGGLQLERPHDISEDLGHLREGLPLLLEVLPRAPKGPALVWRGGYGAAAVTLAQRGASVLAVDRDVLATTYTRRNAALAGVMLQTRDAFALAGGLAPGEHYLLVVGEVHASAGEEATAADLLAAAGSLARGGQGLWLGLTRQARGWLDRLTAAGRLGSTVLATRGAYTVWYVRPAKR